MTEPDETAAPEAEVVPTKAELRDELREQGLPVSGTKDELIERLAEAEVAGEPDADADDDAAEDVDEADEDEADEDEADEDEADEESPAVKAGLIDADGKVDVERVAEFGAEANTLVADVLGALERDLVAVLADYEERHTDAAAAAHLPASRAIRAHMDDARRHLQALATACQNLANG